MKLTRKKKHHIDFEYQLEGSKLEFIDNIKYLGVHIANDLRWNELMLSSISFMCRLNSTGSNTIPCGTPDSTTDHLDFVPFTTTHCLR
jgi:hypothetical protein